MDFQEYYYLMFPEQEKIDNILQEMSVQIPSERSRLRDTYLNLEYTKTVLKYGKFLEKWTCSEHFEFEVYKFSREGDWCPTYYFIHGNQLIAAMIQVSIVSNVVTIHDASGKGGRFSGLVPRIYVEYFLKKYDAIISDNSHTKEGFGMYQELLRNKDRLKISISILDTNTYEEFVVDNLEELGKFYGNTSDFVKYRFVIRKL
jgi:hypothetical protein